MLSTYRTQGIKCQSLTTIWCKRMLRYLQGFYSGKRPVHRCLTGVTNHCTGVLNWKTGLDYWTDIFLVFTHSEVGFASQGLSENLQSATKMMSVSSGVSKT